MGSGSPQSGPPASDPSTPDPTASGRGRDETGRIHQLTLEDLAPVERREVVVASFDDPPESPVTAAVADFGTPEPGVAEFGPAEFDAAEVDAAEFDPAEPGPVEPGEPRVAATFDALEPASFREPPAELGSLAESRDTGPRLTMEDLRVGGRRGRGGAARDGRARAAGRREEPAPAHQPAPARQPAPAHERASVRRRAPAAEPAPVPEDVPGLDTESAAWQAGESASTVGADPERTARPARGARGRQGRRARPAGPPEPDTRSPEEQEAAAKEMCLRLLTDRARTTHELAATLRRKGIAEEVADAVLARFDEVGLIDDEAFAGAWVRSRHAHRGLGRRAIAQELRRKGVDKEVADQALTEVDDEAEARRARELVDRKLRTVSVGSPDERRKVGNRLLGMLARKGYPASIAYGVVRTALAEHGADEDELGPGDPSP